MLAEWRGCNRFVIGVLREAGLVADKGFNLEKNQTARGREVGKVASRHRDGTGENRFLHPRRVFVFFFFDAKSGDLANER